MQGNYISRYLAIAVLTMITSLSVAQKTAPPRPAPMPQQHMSRPPATSTQQVRAPRQQGHAGDWLRRYKDLSPDEQEKALQSDFGILWREALEDLHSYAQTCKRISCQ
jgi:hypothetical protein